MTFTPTDFRDLVTKILLLINTILPVLVALALLAFFWGLVLFMNKSGDPKTHGEGRKFMTWGLVGLFIFFSFMAIIRLFAQDLGFGPTVGIPTLPI